MDLLVAFCLAVGLAACAGLRAFLPLFLLGLGVRLQFPLVSHSQEALFLATDWALLCFGVLALMEIIADLIPVVDTVLQVPAFALRPLAGACAALAVLDMDPSWFLTALFLSVLLGALVSLPIHTTSTTVRVVSTATTAGTANPLLSIKETVLALFGSLAFMVLAPLALAAMLAGLYLLYRWLRPQPEVVRIESPHWS